ncbi:MAG: TAXI family TRAP transporter solute-binding subunit [Synergistaceae bacterium]|nr:TAXI family TRAP transporter solute-binding subunit [Synergistaceae bacterium]
MFKKISIAAVVVLFALTAVIPAFAGTFINISTGPTGGTYYPVGSGIAKIWNDHVPDVKASAQSSGGTRNNIQIMESGSAEVIFADGLYYDAYNGLASYKGEPKKFMRALVPLYPEAVHIVVLKGSGIKTIQDLKNKRVSVGAVGGSVSITADALFKFAGLDPEKDLKREFLGHSESVSALMDKQIDAAVTVGAIGISSVVEPMTLGIVNLIDISDDLVEKMIKKTPYFAKMTIPAGSYTGQKKDIKTFSSPNILAIDQKVDEKTAYLMTKALFENKKALVVISARMSAMNPASVKDIRIPLHPGAVKYYKEIGIIK